MEKILLDIEEVLDTIQREGNTNEQETLNWLDALNKFSVTY